MDASASNESAGCAPPLAAPPVPPSGSPHVTAAHDANAASKIGCASASEIWSLAAWLSSYVTGMEGQAIGTPPGRCSP